MKKNKFIVFEKTKVLDVLKKFSKIGYKSALVVNSNNMLIGSISEGDIRRSLLKNTTLKSNIKKIYNKDPFFLKKLVNKGKIKSLFNKYDYDLIPILDENKRIKKIITWNQSFKKKLPDFSKKKIVPIIMAGGKGLRMKPFTAILPKPLLPIKGKAIIDHIIEKLILNKFKKIFISISENSSILETYLKKYTKNTKLSFVKEKKPLGTIGSIKNIKFQNFEDLLITNCDIKLNLNLQELYKFHTNYKNDMTIVVSKYSIKVPYGVCEFDGEGKLNNIFEKPSHSWFVMCGMYIVNKRAVKFIPKNKYMNIDELIRKLRNKNYKIGVFPIKQSFFNDVGEWDKYLKTIRNKIF
jgi:dTDP-glucose pyrophosphorylase